MNSLGVQAVNAVEQTNSVEMVNTGVGAKQVKSIKSNDLILLTSLKGPEYKGSMSGGENLLWVFPATLIINFYPDTILSIILTLNIPQTSSITNTILRTSKTI